MSKVINIFSSGDSKYFNLASILLTNLYEVHKGYEVNYYALSDHIEPDVLGSLNKIANHYGQEFKYIQIDESEFAYVDSMKKGSSRWGKQAFYWMIAHEYLSDDIETALFLDLDTVVLQDLTKHVFSESLDHKILLISFNHNAKRADLLKGPLSNEQKQLGRIFNSGVLLINLKEMRARSMSAAYYKSIADDIKLLPLVSSFMGEVEVFGDQGFAGFVFEGMFREVLGGTVLQGLSNGSYQYYDETTSVVHYAGTSPCAKHHLASNEELLLGPYQEISIPYLANRMMAKNILDSSSYVDNLLALKHIIDAAGVEFKNLSSFPIYDNRIWVEERFDKSIKLTLAKDQSAKQVFFNVGTLSFAKKTENGKNRVYGKLRTNFSTDKGVRIIVEGVSRNDSKVLGAVFLKAFEVVEFEFEFFSEFGIRSVFITSTDFSGKNRFVEIYDIGLECSNINSNASSWPC